MSGRTTASAFEEPAGNLRTSSFSVRSVALNSSESSSSAWTTTRHSSSWRGSGLPIRRAREEQLAYQQREDLVRFLVQRREAPAPHAPGEDVLRLLQEGDQDHLHALDELRQPVLRRIDEVLEHDARRLLGDDGDPEEAARGREQLLHTLRSERDIRADLDRVVPDPVGADDQPLEDARGVERPRRHQVRGAAGDRAGKGRGLEVQRPVVVLIEDDQVTGTEVHRLGPWLRQCDRDR
jgi:hypothetical protein